LFLILFADPSSRSARVAATVSSTRSTSLCGTNSYQSSRRSSEDSLEEGISIRDVRVSSVFCWKHVHAMLQFVEVIMEILYGFHMAAKY